MTTTLIDFALGHRVHLALLFEPRDLWVGLFWDPGFAKTRFYVTLVPAFPVCVTVYRPLDPTFGPARPRPT